MPPVNESLFGPLLNGPLTTKAQSAANQWAGRTAVASGDTTATVSTTTINSDSLVQIAIQSSVGSNVAQVVKVGSINPGNAMVFGVSPAPVGTDFDILWRIDQTSA